MGVTTSIVTDIPANHHRIPYFQRAAFLLGDRLGRTVSVRCEASMTGPEVLAAVRRVGGIACINSAYLEQIDPALAALTLPFCLSDDVDRRGNVDGIVSFADRLADPHGVRVLALMRGADQLIVHPFDGTRSIGELEGRRVRVAGPGIYESVLRAFGMQPIVQPISGLIEAVRSGRIEAVYTSPGMWAAQLRDLMRNALLVPGSMMITYAVVCAAWWWDALPARDHAAIAETMRRAISGNWREMMLDDERLLAALVRDGAVIATEPDMQGLRERVRPVVEDFGARHGAALRTLRDIFSES